MAALLLCVWVWVWVWVGVGGCVCQDYMCGGAPAQLSFQCSTYNVCVFERACNRKGCQ